MLVSNCPLGRGGHPGIIPRPRVSYTLEAFQNDYASQQAILVAAQALGWGHMLAAALQDQSPDRETKLRLLIWQIGLLNPRHH